MATDLTSLYAGVVINYNHPSTGAIDWRSTALFPSSTLYPSSTLDPSTHTSLVYQTWTFPSDYARGTNPEEQRIPDLAGLQVLVGIDHKFAFTASLDYVVQYFTGDADAWKTVAGGTVIGAHSDGPKVWFDIILPQSIPVTADLATATWRLGIVARTVDSDITTTSLPVTDNGDDTYTVGDTTVEATLIEGVPFPFSLDGVPAFLLMSDLTVTYSIQQGISDLWYYEPSSGTGATPTYSASQADGTPLLGLNTVSSLNFRVLGLVADAGTDFLGNEYRSAVMQTSIGNTSTTAGGTPVLGSGSGNFWMSPPMPSRFAVQSLYFDVRPVQTVPQFSFTNFVGNPSFEYDGVGQAPHWWKALTSGGTVVNQSVYSNVNPSSSFYTSWTYDLFQALHMKYTFSATSQENGIISDFIVAPLTQSPTPMSWSLAYKIITATNCSLRFSLLFYDNNQVILPDPYGTQSLQANAGTGTLGGSTIVPATAAYMKFRVSGVSTGAGSFEGFVDALQVTLTNTVEPYFDGDDVNASWLGQKGQSPSAQVLDPVVSDNFAVIDGVLLDPITFNVAFNVYYSNDDTRTSLSMSEDDWEQKLWKHVPRAYVAVERQQYMLPEPVHAKYVKIEFSNLQSREFDPGLFQKPITYKKFPSWVANFFVNLIDIQSFVASLVNVQYDALSFAYQYFLDDLGSAPDTPVAPPTDALAQLTNYFSNTTNNVDPVTLSKINLAMKPFQLFTGSSSDGTAIGDQAANLLFSQNPPPLGTEGGITAPIDYSGVSSLQREPLLLEQGMPAMYFFVTCRHAYKELTATFQHNRAYFAGVNDIALIRNNYTVASDTPMYIETGGDNANTAFSDFVITNDPVWTVY